MEQSGGMHISYVKQIPYEWISEHTVGVRLFGNAHINVYLIPGIREKLLYSYHASESASGRWWFAMNACFLFLMTKNINNSVKDRSSAV